MAYISPSERALLVLLVVGVPALLLLGFLVYVFLHLNRWDKLSRQLKERYSVPLGAPPLSWVQVHRLEIRTPEFSGSWRNRQLMATSPVGLFLRLDDGLTVLFHWADIKLIHSSKFGFFKAEFTISGFTDGHPISLKLESTDQAVGRFIEQCAHQEN